jgi:uncharacterized protein YPO0396
MSFEEIQRQVRRDLDKEIKEKDAEIERLNELCITIKRVLWEKDEQIAKNWELITELEAKNSSFSRRGRR